jgi:hypothetical protein
MKPYIPQKLPLKKLDYQRKPQMRLCVFCDRQSHLWVFCDQQRY